MDKVIVSGYIFPVIVEYARKKNSSAVIKDGRIILRISSRQSAVDREKHVEELREWAINRIRKDPEKYIIKNNLLKHGQEFTFFGVDYKVWIDETLNKRASAVVKNNIVLCRVPKDYDPLKKNKTVKMLVRNVLTKRVELAFNNYVDELNEKYFNTKISKVKIKNFKGRWGCCGVNNNLDFSFSLLRAPMPIIEYVVVHELAHTVHRNHSARFWRRVEEALPDYKLRKKWLNEYGDELNF